MKTEQRFSFFVHARTEEDLTRIHAKLNADAGDRTEIFAVSDKSGRDILVINAPYEATHYLNGAHADPVSKENVPHLRAGMELRGLQKEVEILRSQKTGAIYTGLDVLTAFQDLGDALSVRQPEL